MANELDPERQKSVLAADYDASAVGYDQHWGPVLEELAKRFITELPLSVAEKILDVGAGSGGLLRHLLATTGALIVGVDRSHGMLALGPANALRAVMDAERLAFRPQSFDAALAMFIVFHLPNPLAGLREIRRVLKDDGTIAFTSWGESDPGFRAFDVFDEALDHHGAGEGRRLYERHDLSDTPQKCALLLEDSGFEVVSVRAERMAHRWTIDHVVGVRTGMGYGRVRWDSLDEEARAPRSRRQEKPWRNLSRMRWCSETRSSTPSGGRPASSKRHVTERGGCSRAPVAGVRIPCRSSPRLRQGHPRCSRRVP